MQRQIKKIAIANRGEVAVRIIQTCRQMGIQTVLLHSEPDRQTRAYRMADQTACIGPSALAESYLNIQANIAGALQSGADAVHPGFGFLSENSDFAKACESSGLVFIGPRPETILLLGDKSRAKQKVAELGVPLIPGYSGHDQSMERLLVEAKKIGYPVLCKAALGGGGRGLKIITTADEAKAAIEASQREGLSSFGSSSVLLEKYLGQAKHIEVQIFGSASGAVSTLLERECSVQRRHQKIIEEAPSALLSEELRSKILKAAQLIGEAVGYKSAGTVEFLVEGEQFYFLEVNTRLQVEHPVTEEVLGIDLVRMQIQTAQGLDLGKMDFPAANGHAIECRLYAENPYSALGVPSTGLLGTIEWPVGEGLRFEWGFEKGDSITPFYDSMIAKVIVHAKTRALAIEKMKATLGEISIFGVFTNIPYLLGILEHPQFVNGTMTTQFIGTYFKDGIVPLEISEELFKLAHQAVREQQTPNFDSTDPMTQGYRIV